MSDVVTVDAMPTTAPSRQLIAAGIKRGAGPLVVEQRLTAPLPAAALHAIARIEDALDAPNRELAAKVGKALGYRHTWRPSPEAGETATRVCVWSVRELDAAFVRVGGTVTAQQVQRTLSDGDTYTITEVTVTVDLPAVGTVQVFTDWDPADEGYGYDLPVIRAAAAEAA